MKKALFVIAFAFVTQFSIAQDDAYKKDVMKVIELNGSAAQMKMAKDQILKMIPAEKQAAFLVEFDASLPSLYDKLVKVYNDVYTKEDIKAILAFYETPIGKKMTAKSAELAEKSQAAGQEWGMGLQAMMMKYMQ